MNKHPKWSLFSVSALFLVFILLTVPTSQAFGQSSGLTISRPLLAAPEIDVQGNGTSIASGDINPSTEDDTDFGTEEVNVGTVSHTFTIYNSGDLELNLTGTPLVAVTGDHASDFTVTDPPTTPVPVSGSTTFTVEFAPSASGLRSAVISIASDDFDEGTYTFSIQGTGETLPGSFNKLSPDDGQNPASFTPTLSWEASTGADYYEYCYDTVDDGSCDSWTNNGNVTSVTLPTLTAGQNYYWQVRAVNILGLTYAQDSISDYWLFVVGALPANFTKFTPVNGAENQATSLTLSWMESVGADSYAFCYDQSDDEACTNWVGVDTSTSIPIYDLTPGATYYWQVKAVNTFGETLADDRTFWSFTVGELPGAFSKSSPSNGALGQLTSLTLEWGDSLGAASYEYCYALTTGCTGWVSTGTVTSAAISGLSYGATYYWQVRAVNTYGETLADGGTYWSFTVGTLPGAFSKISPADGAVDQLTGVTLSWETSAGATDYAYCYATSPGCTSWVSVGTATSAGLSGLSYGATYYWQVRASNTLGDTLADGGAYWSFTVGTLPGAFSKVSPADEAVNQPTSLTLSWGISSGATAYEYCIDSTDDNACATWVSTGATPSAAISGLTYATIYYWQVRATNDLGTTYANNLSTAFWSFSTAFPEMDVRGNSVSIMDGDDSPSPTDGTDFGSAAVLGAIVLHTFTIHNTGPGDLILAGNPLVAISGAAATDFTVSVLPSSVVAPGGSTSFIVVFNPSAVGTRSAVLSIANNDSNENPYNFSIQGSGVAAPEMEVRGNTLQILDGDTTPSLFDHTDFGEAVVTGGTVTHVFTINNLGDATLNLTGNPRVAVSGANAADFSVSVQPSSFVVPGGSTIFTVVFNPSAGGLRSAALSIANNDANENPYNFNIQGTGVNPPAAFIKLLPLNGATEVSTSPSLSWSASTQVSRYEYCIDQTNDNACSNWINNGTNTSVGLSGLSSQALYYWHVRAVNIAGTTYADGLSTAFWNFTTTWAVSPDFYKNTPLNNALDQPVDLTLTWGISVGATSYEYCIDTSDDDACTNWINVGNVTSIAPSGLREETTYYWQVRANNSGQVIYAGGSETAFWSFTTGDFFVQMYLPVVRKT